MKRIIPRAVGACLVLSSVGNAADLRIDSPEGGVRAVLIAAQLRDDIPSRYRSLANTARDLASGSLSLLGAKYTPAKVRAKPKGVVIPCQLAGEVRARYIDGLLAVRYDACATGDPGGRRVMNGPVRMHFEGDTFAPLTLDYVRVGLDGENFTIESTTGRGGLGNEEFSSNVTLAGLIPIAIPASDFTYEGHFEHTIEGFTQGVSHLEFPSVSTSVLTAAPGSFAIGEFRYDSAVFEDIALFGSFTLHSEETGKPDLGIPPSSDQTSIANAFALRALHTWNPNGVENWSVSGAADYAWSVRSRLSCANGRYTFAMPVPWRHTASRTTGPDTWDAGKLLVNGVSAVFSANQPGGLPPMHVAIDIPGGGQFHYDTTTVFSTALFQLALCPN